MKTRLIGSAPDIDQLIKLIETKYFYSKIHLVEACGFFTVHNSDKKIEGFRVIKKGKRFRFERFV